MPKLLLPRGGGWGVQAGPPPARFVTMTATPLVGFQSFPFSVEIEPAAGEAVFLTTHTLVNETASSLAQMPYSFGQGFAQGDVPAGNVLAINTPDGTPVVAQFNDRSYWPDNSLKHCRIMLIVPAIAGNGSVALRINRQPGAWNDTGSRSVADILANADYDLLVDITGMVVSGSANKPSAGSGHWRCSLFDALRNGRVKTVSAGPAAFLVEAVHAFVDAADGGSHATAEHRWYATIWERPGLPLEYLCTLEQHKMFTECGRLDYSAVLKSAGGSIIHDYGQIPHIHHGAWHTVDADGTTRWRNLAKPPIHGRIDRAYWRATRLVPSYDPDVVMTPADDPEILSYTPMANHDVRPFFGTPGADDTIGLQPHWVAKAFCSANAPGYMRRSRINGLTLSHWWSGWRNDQAGMEFGNYMDSTGTWEKLGPALPNLSLGRAIDNPPGDHSSINDFGGRGPYFQAPDHAHYPSLVYYHWLMEGARHWLNLLHQDADWLLISRETALSGIFARNPTENGVQFHCICVFNLETRGAGWSTRELLLAAGLTPTETVDPKDPVLDYGRYFNAVKDQNINFVEARVAANGQAFKNLGHWDGAGRENVATWMHEYLVLGLGLGYGVTADENIVTKALSHLIKWPTGLQDTMCGYWVCGDRHNKWLWDDTGFGGYVGSFDRVLCSTFDSPICDFRASDNRIVSRTGFLLDFMREGDPIRFTRQTGNDSSQKRTVPPDPFDERTIVFARDIDPVGNSFRVSATPGGAALDIPTDANGVGFYFRWDHACPTTGSNSHRANAGKYSIHRETMGYLAFLGIIDRTRFDQWDTRRTFPLSDYSAEPKMALTP